MAAIQSIRSHGKWLIIIIGVALLAFITEEYFRARQGMGAQNANVMGTINGKKISVQEYNGMVESLKSFVEFTQGKTSFTEEEDASLKEQAWQNYVGNKLIAEEADKLGLTVTDDELRAVLAEGTNPMLEGSPFAGPDGRFSATTLKSFLDELAKMKEGHSQVPAQYQEQYAKLDAYWQFVEKSLREQILQQKYTSLLSMSVTSNPVEAKMAYDAISQSADIDLIGVPYAAINDKDVPVTDAELQAKYEELKEAFKTAVTLKDIKYVAVNVKASAADKAALDKKMAGFAAELGTATDLASVVRRSQSSVNYVNGACTAEAFPSDIAQVLDSVGVGSVKGPYYNALDNTQNIIKLVSKTTAPDSILARVIQVGGKDVDDARKRADSIYNALNAGANFKELAQKYNQTGDSAWTVSSQYQTAAMDDDFRNYYNELQTMGPGSKKNFEFAQGNIIVEVLQTKAPVAKYNAAVIKCPVAFSNETSKTEYNKFSKFVADNKTIEAMEKNAAKNGYKVETLSGQDAISTSDFFAVGKYNSAPGTDKPMMRWISRDAQKWIFDDAEDGEVSPLYTCDNGAHLLVVAVVKTHKPGYLTLEDDFVKDVCKREVLRDKKAEKIIASLKGAGSIEAVKAKYATADTASVKNITFMSDGQADPVILGSVVGKKAGAFVGPLKGVNAVYAYKVAALTPNKDAKYDEKQFMQVMGQQHARGVLGGALLYTCLAEKAELVDNRYAH